jgi:hypothetical protein
MNLADTVSYTEHYLQAFGAPLATSLVTTALVDLMSATSRFPPVGCDEEFLRTR